MIRTRIYLVALCSLPLLASNAQAWHFKHHHWGHGYGAPNYGYGAPNYGYGAPSYAPSAPGCSGSYAPSYGCSGAYMPYANGVQQLPPQVLIPLISLLLQKVAPGGGAADSALTGRVTTLETDLKALKATVEKVDTKYIDKRIDDIKKQMDDFEIKMLKELQKKGPGKVDEKEVKDIVDKSIDDKLKAMQDKLEKSIQTKIAESPGIIQMQSKVETLDAEVKKLKDVPQDLKLIKDKLGIK